MSALEIAEVRARWTEAVRRPVARKSLPTRPRKRKPLPIPIAGPPAPVRAGFMPGRCIRCDTRVELGKNPWRWYDRGTSQKHACSS